MRAKGEGHVQMKGEIGGCFYEIRDAEDCQGRGLAQSVPPSPQRSQPRGDPDLCLQNCDTVHFLWPPLSRLGPTREDSGDVTRGFSLFLLFRIFPKNSKSVICPFVLHPRTNVSTWRTSVNKTNITTLGGLPL